MSDTEIAADGGHSTERDDAVRALGAPVGLRLASLTNRVQELLSIRRIRDARVYKQLGYTWDSYCQRVLGRSPNVVEEELLTFQDLGEQLFLTAEFAGLGRNDLRALRKIPEDARPRLLPGGEIELGDRRVPVTPEHREEVVELLEDLLTAQRELRQIMDRGEQQLQQRDTTLAELKREVKELQSAPRVHAGLGLSDTARAASEVEIALAALVEQVYAERPDPEMVLRIYRRLAAQMSELAQYGGGYRAETAAPEGFDADALEETARALEEAERD